MVKSKCASCGNTKFEIVEQSPAGSNYKIYFVQCASCGIVVGTQEYYSAGFLMKEQEKEIDLIKNSLSSIIFGINEINKKLVKK